MLVTSEHICSTNCDDIPKMAGTLSALEPYAMIMGKVKGMKHQFMGSSERKKCLKLVNYVQAFLFISPIIFGGRKRCTGIDIRNFYSLITFELIHNLHLVIWRL